MQKFNCFLALICVLGWTCSSQKKIGGSGGFISCENLPGLRFQNQSDTIVASSISQFAIEVAAAAKKDAKTGDSLPQTGASGSINGETGRIVNQKLSNSSHVTTEFWQQDIVFRQVICFLERQSEKRNIPGREKETIRQAILDIVKARSEYLNQIQNKWPDPVLKVEPFIDDTLQFRVTNVSGTFPLVIENMYFGLITCSGNPANLSGEGIQKVEIIDLPGVNMKLLNEANFAIPITKDKYEISVSQTTFFQLPYSKSDVKVVADSAAAFKCRNPAQIFGELGEMYLFLSYVNPVTGGSEKLNQLVYKGIARSTPKSL